MTEKSRVVRLVSSTLSELLPARRPPRSDHPHLLIKIARPTATVLLKRPFRDAAYIRRHVSYVVKESTEQGEQHIIRNLLSIRRKLVEMGLDREVIDREMQSIEGEVRAELWRQILLPEVP